MVDEPDEAVLICQRCSQLASPHIESEKRQCSGCGEAVWVDTTSLEVIAERVDVRIRICCLVCAPDMSPGNTTMTAGQLERLLAEGFSPHDVAHLWALMAVGGASLNAAAWEIIDDPTGERAGEYVRHYVDAATRIRNLLSRN